jgi:hypothetical protein
MDNYLSSEVIISIDLTKKGGRNDVLQNIKEKFRWKNFGGTGGSAHLGITGSRFNGKS